MIVLRKIALGTNVILGASLIGSINGNNKVFTTEFNYEASSITIDYNGQTLHSGVDFNETASNEVTLIYIAPSTGSTLKATYEKSP